MIVVDSSIKSDVLVGGCSSMTSSQLCRYVMATMEHIHFQRDGDSARPVLDQHVINHGLS